MRVFSIKKESIIFVICMGIIFAGLINSIDKKNKTQETFFMPLAKKIILIDAGHGGWDPGKVAKNNSKSFLDDCCSIRKKSFTFASKSKPL